MRSPGDLGGVVDLFSFAVSLSHRFDSIREWRWRRYLTAASQLLARLCIGPGLRHRQCWCSFVCHLLYSSKDSVTLEKRLWFVWYKYASFIHSSNSQITSLSDQCCLVYFPVASAEFQFVLNRVHPGSFSRSTQLTNMLPWYPVFLVAGFRVCWIPIRSKSLYILLWVRNFSRSNQLNSMLPWYPLACCWILGMLNSSSFNVVLYPGVSS